MKRSIRTRLFIWISVLILFFVSFSWILNARLLEKYYIYKKKNSLIENFNRINNIYKGNPYDIMLELEALERNSGISVVIMSRGYDARYNSRIMISPTDPESIKKHLVEMLPFMFKAERLAKGQFVIDTVREQRLNSNFLNLASLLNTGDIILLSTPIAAIHENASIANDFFLITGILTFVIGCIGVFIFSRRFTKPILELNEIARSMAKLDFSKKYYGEPDDEIGQLGTSINSLSNQLDISISELREANKKLLEDIERERKIDEMRKEFISSVSHELKTPISLIQGYAEGLKLNIADDEESRNFYSDVIVDEAHKMDKLVRDLLDLSQIDSGNFRLDRETFDLSALIDGVLLKYEPVLREKGIKVEVEKQPGMEADGDVVRIEQVIVNYLNNAINHVDDEKTLRITVKSEDSKIRVYVYNSGMHIPEEYIDKIWISFYKVDKARTRSYGGTGLGLSVVRAIQNLHNNGYGVSNVEGGVEFWFDIDKKNA